MTLLAVPDPLVKLEVSRCHDCGHWWALEQYQKGRCPRCAQGSVDRAWEETQHAQRQVAALRGTLTRARKRNSDRFSVVDVQEAVQQLQAAHVPPGKDGTYHMAIPENNPIGQALRGKKRKQKP